MSIKSNHHKQLNHKNWITDKKDKSDKRILLTPEILSKMFVPYSHIGGHKDKMSSIKPSPNPKLSKEHIEILKRELGFVEGEDDEVGTHEKPNK